MISFSEFHFFFAKAKNRTKTNKNMNFLHNYHANKLTHRVLFFAKEKTERKQTKMGRFYFYALFILLRGEN